MAFKVSNHSAKTEDHLKVNLGFGGRPLPFPLAGFPIGGDNYNPLRINYSMPLILSLNEHSWNKEWVVYPENYNSSDWVRLAQMRSCYFVARKRIDWTSIGLLESV